MNMIKTVGIRFPIKKTEEGGVFLGSKTTDQALKSDLIALLTLRKGQRPMQSRMYSPIYDYLHEPLDEITTDELNTKIKEKIQEFIPQIRVNKLVFNRLEEQNLLSIKIVYTIETFFDVQETLTLNFPVLAQ